jgi:hypothetical protein
MDAGIEEAPGSRGQRIHIGSGVRKEEIDINVRPDKGIDSVMSAWAFDRLWNGYGVGETALGTCESEAVAGVAPNI